MAAIGENSVMARASKFIGEYQLVPGHRAAGGCARLAKFPPSGNANVSSDWQTPSGDNAGVERESIPHSQRDTLQVWPRLMPHSCIEERQQVSICDVR